MIPILYEKTEAAFASNGICRLQDCISCVVTEERNGIYELDFEYPVTGRNFSQIIPGRIIAAEHDDSGDVQPFDIVGYSKPISGVVTFHAVHISYRQTQMVANGSNIQSLSDAFTMLGNAEPENPFEYDTDITGSAFMASADGIPKSVRQFLGGVEGSILDTWGGEYEFDRFAVHLWEARGQRRNVTIRYGLNLTDYNEDADYSQTYTSAVPFWSGDDGAGGTVTVIGSRVDSGLDSYSGRNECAALDLTDKFETKPTAAQLQNLALAQMQNRDTNLPDRTISVNFVNLRDTDEYANFAPLERCGLCDTVNVVLPRYGINQTFKIVKTVWDVLGERYNELELGTLSTSLADALGIGQSSDGSATADPVEYVTGTGTVGDWRYIKYSSGRFEAWYNHSGSVTLGTALANASGWYRNTNAYTLTVPTEIGTATVTHADIHPISGLAGMSATVTGLSGGTTSYYVICPAASGSAISGRATVITAYVAGTWT